MKSNENENKIDNIFSSIEYKGNTYKLVCNLNVLENLQNEYTSFDNWTELVRPTDPKKETDIKALKFAFKEMLNEGIDITNEDEGTDTPLFNDKQVGRIITEVGLTTANEQIMKAITESTKSTEKN